MGGETGRSVQMNAAEIAALMPYVPAAQKRELEQLLATVERQQAQRIGLASTAGFACSVDIPTVPADDQEESPTMRLRGMAAHHKLLCDKLDELEAGIIPNL